MSDKKSPLIDGFALGYGEANSLVVLKDNTYTINTWKGTYKEAVDSIKKGFNCEEAENA